MVAGRELDALVAKDVMGLPVGVCREIYYYDHELIGFQGARTTKKGRARIPNYSTSITAAWEVVEKLRSRGVYLDVEPRSDRWDCAAGWAGQEDEDIWVQAFTTSDTAPHVICLAALASIPLTAPEE